jgi:hypothetical protein
VSALSDSRRMGASLLRLWLRRQARDGHRHAGRPRAHA